MKKLITTTLLFISAFLAHSTIASAFSGATEYNTSNSQSPISWNSRTFAQGKLRYMTFDGSTVGVMSEIPHYSQPNDYTCGAANLAMAKAWTYFVETGRMPAKPDIMAIYNQADKDGAKGLTTNELKEAIRPIVGLSHREYGWDTIDQALDQYVFSDHLVRSFQSAPGIVYGNVRGGSAGGHYYSMAGAIYCDHAGCNNDYNGAYFFDSVFGSPAYVSKEPKRADYPGAIHGFILWVVEYTMWSAGIGPGVNSIGPGIFLTSAALEDYWKPTGASLPWNKKHYYLLFTP